MSQNSFPPLSAAPAVDETSQVAKENVVSDQEKSFGFSVTSTSSAISTNSSPPLSAAPVQDEAAPVTESNQAQSVVANQAFQEWGAMRAQQDQECNKSLSVDQEKERKKLAYQTCEERRLKAIEARRQRMSACEEPSDGVLIKFKYPNGRINMRKFSLSEPIQILFDFVGQDDIASEIFVVQEATSSRPIESSSSGAIMDHGIKASSTLYVLWFSNQDVQEILSGQQNDGSHGQSSLSEPSTQPSLSEPSSHPPLTLFSQPQEILTLHDEPSLPPSSAQEPVIILDEQDETISQNLSPVSTHHLGGPVDEIDLQTILKKLVSKVDGSFCPTSNQINVCRDNVFLCSLRAFKRRNFNPEAKLDVVFVDEDDNGEGAVDEGGPTREYLRLLMRAVHQSNIFEGHEKDRRLSLDTQALQTKLYAWVAKMIAVCVVHGGVGPHFFSQRLFHQICGIPTSPATVDEVGDHTFREQLTKIQEATTVQEANSAIAEAADSLSIIGAWRHVSSLQERDSLIQSAADFFVNGRLATALDQFAEGLKTLGLLEELRKNPAVFYSLFVSEEIPLQAKDLCTLFDVDFSVQGSNRRDRENTTICFWRDWLIDIEEGECSPVTLEKILEFTCGASTVPPLGFPHRPQIQFLHEGNRIFPEANTCVLVLHLPLHSSYEAFKQYMMEGILKAPTFGLV
ncbi:G2/M phase-specific E3 ubiquitin-protein ligase-like [Chaetodon auriga]|uniref:G2/M phase-specific E3 ubiquitin-protein ligase-like n=1 Tax=Chaetodon auriga TaxID=39042 RepID=UPI00403295EA